MARIRRLGLRASQTDQLRVISTKRLERLRTRHIGRSHILRINPRHRIGRYIEGLEEELILCKLAMRSDGRIPEQSQMDAYRSLWFIAESRLKELGDVLVNHLDEDIVKSILPYHNKFKHRYLGDL